MPDVVKEAAKAVEAEKRAKVEKELDHLRASIRRSVASISGGLGGLRSDRCCEVFNSGDAQFRSDFQASADVAKVTDASLTSASVQVLCIKATLSWSSV
jgi:hypothetical protein